jgi:hypothetical protein
MKSHFYRSIIISLFFVLIFGISTSPFSAIASALSTGRLDISALDTSQFPIVKFNMEVFDPSGNFLADVTKDQVTVIEDGKSITLDSLDRIEPGIQIILAYNPSSAFAVTAPGGNYFTYIQKTLKVWAQNQPTNTPNSLTIATNTGLQAVQLTDVYDWQQAVSSYQPELMSAQSSLISLSLALDLATDPAQRPGMHTVIFYITSLLPNELIDDLPNQIERALLAKVPVFVWVVAPNGTANTEASESLIQLAGNTGGQFYVVSTSEELPGLDTYLQPMRFLYQAVYTSQINQSDTHILKAVVERSGETLTSSEASFTINVQPPSPIFLSPPSVVDRAKIKDEEGKRVLSPSTVPISYLIEFPDGHTRELKAVRLFADETLVAQSTTPPFNVIKLPLEDIQESKTIQLQLEVEDTLGLVQRSIQIPIQVNVEPSGLDAFMEPANLFKFGVGIAGVLALAAIIYLVFRLRKKANIQRKEQPLRIVKKGGKKPLNRSASLKIGSKPTGKQKQGSAAIPARQPLQRQPLYQNPSAEPVATRPVRKAETPTIPVPPLSVSILCSARLVWLNDDGQVLSNPPLALTEEVVTVGNDMRQVTRYIDSPELNPLHARFHCTSDGTWTVADCNSIAGTYINYNPVEKQTAPLQHGDIVQLGRIMFRFEMANPTKIPRPIVKNGQGT